MERLTLDGLLAAGDITPREVELPGGGSVVVQGFTKSQVDEFREAATDGGDVDRKELEKLWFLNGLVEPRLTEADYAALTKKSGGLYYRILNAILEESGLTGEVQKQTRKSFRPES